MVQIGNDWDERLKGEFEKPYYQELRKFLIEEYRHGPVYPGMYDIFNALKYTSFSGTRAVILGQDPYHGPGQAHGLCFSVKKGVEPPPSLQNIFKELHADTGTPVPSHGELTDWARSGVLMLNTVLTVREHMPNSHKGKGWEILTDRIISELNKKENTVVFLLWGANARSKAALITNPKHRVLQAAHPSPLSAYNGFFGCRHFSETNRILIASGQSPIDWSIHD